MKNTDKNQPKQGQGKIKPRVRPAKVEQSEEERKQAEEALRESEEKYRSLVERANDGITIIQDGVVKFANTRLVEMWGGTVEEVLETPFANHIHPDDLPAMVERYQQRMAGEDIPPMYETVLLRSDGSKVYVEINAGVIAYLGKPADLVMVRDVTERKRAEEALRESEKRYLSLIETTPDVIYALTQEGTIAFLNSAFERITGWSRSEWIGKSFVSLVHPDDLPLALETFQQAILGETSSPYELRVLTKRGDYLVGEFISMPHIEKGKVIGEFGIARDVTQRKRAEESLIESEARLSAIFDSVQTGIVIIDPEIHVIIDANPVAVKMIGTPKEQIIGSICHRFICPAEVGRCPITDLKQTVNSSERVLLTVGGACPIMKTVIPVMLGGRKYLLENFIDITERKLAEEAGKRAEEALRKSEERFKQVAENADEWIWEINANGLYTYASPVVERILGFKPEEIVGKKHFYDLFAPDIREELKQAAFETFARKEAFRDFVNPNVHKSGDIVILETSGTPVVDNKGNLLGYRGVGTDITARKRAEEKIRQRNEELSLLNAINQAVNRGESLETIIRLIAKETEPLFNCSGVILHLLSPDRRRLVMQNPALPPATVKKIEKLIGIPFPRIEHDLQTAHPYRQVLESGRSQVINDPEVIQEFAAAFLLAAPFSDKIRTRLKPLIPTIVKLFGYQSVLTVLMIANDEIIGTLDLGRREPFTDEDAKRLESIANQLTAAIKRKRAEEALRESEEKYRTILENIEEGYFEVDIAGNFTFFNESVCRLLGYSREEMMGMNNRHYTDKTNAQKLYRAFNQVYRTGVPAQGHDWELIRKDSTKRYVECSVSSRKNKSSQPIGFRGIIRDTTERKQAEESIRASEERFAKSFHANPIAICVSAFPDGRMVEVNEAFLRLIGYKREEVIGRSGPELDLWNDPEVRTSIIRELLESGSVRDLEGQLRAKSGHLRDILASAETIQLGGRPHALIMLSDITKRKRAEAALAEERNLLRTLIDNLPDYIYVKDSKGQFVLGNMAVTRQMGVSSPDELVGKSDFDLFPHEIAANYDALEQEIIRSGQGVYDYEGPTVDVSKEEENRWVSTTKVPLRGAQGKIVGFVGLGRDITERKQMADELRQRYTELALLYEAGLTINRELDPHLQLEKLFKTAMQALQADHAEFSRYDAARGTVQFELSIGYSPEAQDKLRGLVAYDGEAQGLIGLIAQNRQPLNLPDVHADPRYVAVDPEIRSALWVPVARENQLLGVLGVLSTRPNAFTDQHERLLSLFANQAAVALENARLFEETSRRLEHVQTLRTIDMVISSSLDLRVIFDVFLEQATRQLEVHAADILLLNPHTQMLDYTAGRGFRTAALQHTYLRLGESLAGRAALERRIVHIPDLAAEPDGLARAPKLADEGFVAYFAVPLIAKGLVKGVFEIFHRAPLEADQEWLDFVETLAGQAAIAIDNVTLFNDLQRSNVELTLAYDATIEGWSHALDLRDKETEGHTQRVADLTLRLAQVMGVSDTEMVHVRRGALLHDIGKMGIPDEILRKPASLDEPEWVVMRQHPLYAYDMLSPISYLRPALDIPYCHHEKWDGSGYPRGLAREQIPLAARLFAVVDVYDALTSDRPYRKAWSRKKALEYIQQQAGQHFDPEIVSAFMGMPALHELWNGDKISQT